MPSLKGPIIALLLLPVITFAMYQSALEIAAGGSHHFVGKNAVIKNLIYWLGGTLGAAGSLIVGGVMSLAALMWLVKTIQKRKLYKSLPVQV